MKIGTISLNINAPDFNYGAMLHSWAFQKYLKKLDYVEYTEIIDYTMPTLEGQNLKHPIWSAFCGLHPRSFLYYIKNYRMYQKRFQKFNEFIERNICKSKNKYTQKTLDEAILDYDCVICESDVIWAPGFCGGHFDKSFFMALKSMQNMKKIAYAPSMSDGDLNESQGEELSELLRYPDMISCRESYEKAILEKYTDKKIEHVLDPVMLLDKKDYLPICAKRIIPEKYLLLYLPVDDNIKLRNYADVVFTNSFHAICFSILFNVQFYAFSRAYAGKVKDICKVFGLENRFFVDDNFVEQKLIDYEEVNMRYEQLKEHSIHWLENALQGE